MSFQSRTRLHVLFGTLGIVSAMLLLGLWRSSKSTPKRPPDPMADVAWQRIAPRLEQADREGIQSGEHHLLNINEFFAQKQQFTTAFAEDVLGWSGKWAFVKGKLTGDDGRSHQEFLRKAFERHIFTNHDLQQLLQSTIAGYVSELDGQESAALVAIRADLSEQDLPSLRSVAAFRSEAAFAEAFKSTLAEVVPIVGRDLNVTVAREIGVWVGSEIATAVTIRTTSALATRLGISSGILGTGAASGVVTFGVGLGVGFVVDAAVDWMMR
jgi:hypothetical protein